MKVFQRYGFAFPVGLLSHRACPVSTGRSSLGGKGRVKTRLDATGSLRVRLEQTETVPSLLACVAPSLFNSFSPSLLTKHITTQIGRIDHQTSDLGDSRAPPRVQGLLRY